MIMRKEKHQFSPGARLTQNRRVDKNIVVAIGNYEKAIQTWLANQPAYHVQKARKTLETVIFFSFVPIFIFE